MLTLNSWMAWILSSTKCLHFCFPLLIKIIILFVLHAICVFYVLYIICDLIILNPLSSKWEIILVETLFNVSHQRCSFNDRRNLKHYYISFQNYKICKQNLSNIDPICCIVILFSPPLSLRYFELRMNTLNSTKEVRAYPTYMFVVIVIVYEKQFYITMLRLFKSNFAYGDRYMLGSASVLTYSVYKRCKGVLLNLK